MPNFPRKEIEHFQRTMQLMSSNDDAGGALRAAAKPGLAIYGLRPKPWHDRSPRRTACGVPTRPPDQICHEGAQARTATLERAALMRLVKQLRATLGDAVSMWADFVTHANARYKDAIADALQSGTSVLTKLASLASVGTFSTGGAGVQAVREGGEPETGLWIE